MSTKSDIAVFAMALGVVAGMSQLDGCGNGSGTMTKLDMGMMNMQDMTQSPPMLSLLAGGISMQGSTDGTGAAARFGEPYMAASDGAGNLYVTDQVNSTIRNVSSVENPPRIFPDTVVKAWGEIPSSEGCGATSRRHRPDVIGRNPKHPRQVELGAALLGAPEGSIPLENRTEHPIAAAYGL